MPKKRSRRKRHSAKREAQIEARRILRDFVLLRDGDTCQKCGSFVYGSNAHTSHVYPKGMYRRLEFEPINVKLLCMPCHSWWHSSPSESFAWWETKFPGRASIMRLFVETDADWQAESLTLAWYRDRCSILTAMLTHLELGIRKESHENPDHC